MLGSSTCPMEIRTKAFAGMRPDQAVEVIADGAEAGIQVLARLKPWMKWPGSQEIESYRRGRGPEIHLDVAHYDEAMRLFEAECLRDHV